MTTVRHEHARVLVVDDQEANVQLLSAILRRSGYTNIKTCTDPRDVEGLYESYRPDVILLDLHMPHINGFGVLELLAARLGSEEFLPVLVLTADLASPTKKRALELGATDFLTKPFDITEVLLRLRNLLATRFLHAQVLSHKAELEERVRARTREVEEAHLETLGRLALAAEFRDDDTGRHTHRVGARAAQLAATLGLPRERVEMLRVAAPLHDVGKIGVPDGVLLKPGKVTREEMAVIRGHPTIGAKILASSRSELLQLCEAISLHHHERWDGGGYPHGLRAAEIPIEARIVAVADVFDALTHTRPYKKAWSMEDALEELRRQRGTQFDPEVVDAFIAGVQAGLEAGMALVRT
jgi:putative two-component system response regulator